MAILQIDSLTKSYGDRVLFEDVTFGVEEGDKIGIIAKNGTGKSTLLSVIAGVETPDSGTIVMRSGLKIGYLEQTPRFPAGITVAEAVGADEESMVRASSLLTQLSITDKDAVVENLSGGQQKRVALVKMLIEEPDILILDEPTNHLDVRVIEWLEGYLKRSRATLLMVTHDRYFLDRVCNRIIEIFHKHVYMCEGNYAEYLRRREERLSALTGELAKVRNTLRKETEWMRRQPQARAGKARYRIEQYNDLVARSKANYAEKNVTLDIKSSYIGSKIFEAKHVSKRFGERCVLNDFSYTFARYERVGIVGDNGVGKSSFIKMLQGILKPDSGEFEIGETVRFGYYSQEGISFDENKLVIDAVTELCDDVVLDGNRHYSPMQFLQRFLFSPADQQKRIAKLSGGERARLHLAVVLMRQPNFLVLDEPTNDLDIVTLGILEEYLSEFKGCLIVVSHDRFFLDSVVDHLFAIEEGGKVRDFPGGYSDYLAAIAKEKAQNVQEKEKQADSRRQKTAQRPPKLTWKEQRELESLTAEIEELEKEKASLEESFSSGDSGIDVHALSARYSQVTARLDQCTDRWIELSDKA